MLRKDCVLVVREVFAADRLKDGEVQSLSRPPDDPTVADMLAQNDPLLGNRIVTKLRHGIVPGSAQPSWPEFRARYASCFGVIRFSRVGLDPQQAEALLFSVIGTGELGGKGGFYALQHLNGAWRVVKYWTTWIS